jgi:hypothetical protein
MPEDNVKSKPSVTDISDADLINEVKSTMDDLNFYAEECLRRQITLVYGVGSETAQFDDSVVVPKLSLKAAAKQLMHRVILIPRR